MIWQDVVFSVGGIAMLGFLLPTVFSHQKPPVTTAFPTGLILALYGVTDLTLRLYGGALVIFLTALVWWVIGAQGWQRGRTEP